MQGAHPQEALKVPANGGNLKASPPAPRRMGSAPTASAERYQVVSRNLEVLASPIRLAILARLRTPTPLHLIRVEADAASEGGPRVLSRQAVSWHLRQLVDAGLVHRLPGEARTQIYVLNHERLFALVDEMRDLSRLRPMGAGPGPGATIDRSGDATAHLPSGPRLILVYGRDEGAGYSLERDAVVLGREPGCDVRLDYDAYASGRHARILRQPEGFLLEDLGSRNGTRVNGDPITKPRRLHPGDVLTIGRSYLVFQHPP